MLNPDRLGVWRKPAVAVGLVQLTVVGGIGLALALAFDHPLRESLMIALALTASSTLVVVQILQRRRQFYEPFGRLVLGVLLVQDLALIALLAVAVRVEDGPPAVLAAIAATLGLIALTWVFIRWLTPLLLVRLGLDDEPLLLVVLATLFGFSALANRLGLPWITGAFFAGVSLAAFPAGGLIRGQLLSLTDFFVAVFVVCLGATLVWPVIEDAFFVAAIVAVVVLVTPVLVTIVAERFGMSARASIESGLLLAQTSELSLVLAVLGHESGYLSTATVSAVTLVTVATMAMTPLLSTDRLTWRLMSLHPSQRRRARVEPRSEHVVVVGCGDNGSAVLEALQSDGVDAVGIDDDPAVVRSLQDRGIDVVRGDGSSRSALRAARAFRARLVISTMPRIADSVRLIRSVEAPVIVRVFEADEEEAIRMAGGTPVQYADAGVEVLLDWFRGPLGGNGQV